MTPSGHGQVPSTVDDDDHRLLITLSIQLGVLGYWVWRPRTIHQHLQIFFLQFLLRNYGCFHLYIFGCKIFPSSFIWWWHLDIFFCDRIEWIGLCMYQWQMGEGTDSWPVGHQTDALRLAYRVTQWPPAYLGRHVCTRAKESMDWCRNALVSKFVEFKVSGHFSTGAELSWVWSVRKPQTLQSDQNQAWLSEAWLAKVDMPGFVLFVPYVTGQLSRAVGPAPVFIMLKQC